MLAPLRGGLAKAWLQFPRLHGSLRRIGDASSLVGDTWSASLQEPKIAPLTDSEFRKAAPFNAPAGAPHLAVTALEQQRRVVVALCPALPFTWRSVLRLDRPLVALASADAVQRLTARWSCSSVVCAACVGRPGRLWESPGRLRFHNDMIPEGKVAQVASSTGSETQPPWPVVNRLLIAASGRELTPCSAGAAAARCRGRCAANCPHEGSK